MIRTVRLKTHKRNTVHAAPETAAATNLLVPLLWLANETLQEQTHVLLVSNERDCAHTYDHLPLVLLNIVRVDLYPGLVVPGTFQKNPPEIVVGLIIDT